MSQYTLDVLQDEPAASSSERDQVLGILRDYNREQIAANDFRPLTVVIRDEQGAVLGGCIGRTYWHWLEIEYLAIAPELRRSGYGAKLLAAAEAEAVARGCRAAFLDTFSFQARPFYEKQGYRVFGALDDFPPGHSRYFLKKKL